MSATHLHHLAQLIGNDNHAATFQSMGQYRSALLKEIDQACAEPEQEAILIQAVAVTREDDDEGLRLEWLLEGGIAELESAGTVLFAMPEANDLCDADGSAYLYHRPDNEIEQLRALNTRLGNHRDAILLQARVWAGEAKTQQAITREVGEILGGVPNWGPIAAGVEALRRQLAKANAQLEQHVPLYEAINRAAGELPDGWNICLNVERHGGGVELFDQHGHQVEDFPSNNERLDYTVNDAVDAALDAYRAQQRRPAEETLWIEHGPSKANPFTHPYSSKVDVRLRDGTEKIGDLACNFTWFWYGHDPRDYDVVAYRAHRAQQGVQP